MSVFWLGTVTGGTILYFGLLLGLSAIPQGYGIIFIFIKAVAAILFITIGMLGMRDAENLPLEEAEAKAKKLTKQSIATNFFSGFFLTLGNPYVIVFVPTVIPALVNDFSFTVQNIIMIRSVAVFADILVILAYCTPLFLIRKKIPPQYLMKIRFFTSMAMVCIGIFLMINIVLNYDLTGANLVKNI